MNNKNAYDIRKNHENFRFNFFLLKRFYLCIANLETLVLC